MKLAPNLLTLTINRYKKGCLIFFLTTVGLVGNVRLFSNRHFIHTSELEADDSPKRPALGVLGLQNIFFINTDSSYPDRSITTFLQNSPSLHN